MQQTHATSRMAQNQLEIHLSRATSFAKNPEALAAHFAKTPATPLNAEASKIWRNFFAESLKSSHLDTAMHGVAALANIPGITLQNFAPHFKRVFAANQRKVAWDDKPERASDPVLKMFEALTKFKWSPAAYKLWEISIAGPDEWRDRGERKGPDPMCGGDYRALPILIRSGEAPGEDLFKLSVEGLLRFRSGPARQVILEAIGKGISERSYSNNSDRMASVMVREEGGEAILLSHGDVDSEVREGMFVGKTEALKRSSQIGITEYLKLLAESAQFGMTRNIIDAHIGALPEVPKKVSERVLVGLSKRKLETTPVKFLRQLKTLPDVDLNDGRTFAVGILKLSATSKGANLAAIAKVISSW